ncbi:hypothetical protein ETW23_00355 [Leisingera sp. NJS201]|uniref:hypothetical protein n=1 Tax=Leisingera sp. NJS201 TaxID=2508306 RepID=UPI001070A409|nr:hypothetical protein [Leisingera sp. NJS201]QBR34849.1 hypothetical protein ETW23_00355 [Leisingera sp. NJS201]
MYDCTLTLSEREQKDIALIARDFAAQNGLPPVSVDEMATELLRSHLVLCRDCPGVLPAPDPDRLKRTVRKRLIKGKGGVSLQDGVNAKA